MNNSSKNDLRSPTTLLFYFILRQKDRNHRQKLVELEVAVLKEDLKFKLGRHNNGDTRKGFALKFKVFGILIVR